jgi:5-methylcytosine-specific restriction endonuclease McrA
MSMLDAVPASCPFRPNLQAVPGRCGRVDCNAPLPPRRRRWCSDRCVSAAYEVAWENHYWGSARDAALERDGYKCVRCGADGAVPQGERDAIGPMPDFPADLKPRDRNTFAHSDAGRVLRERLSAWRDAWEGLRLRFRLEVNHIVPANGAHGVVSCVHHLDNIETLCHPCHVKVTNAQRNARRSA